MAENKTVNPKDYEDQFSIMHAIKSTDVVNRVGNLLQEIGAQNLSNADYIKFIAAMRKGRLTDPVIEAADKYNEYMDAKAQKEQAERNRIAQQQRAEELKPENLFPKIWRARNTQPARIQEWLKQTGAQELIQLKNLLEQDLQRWNSVYDFTITDAVQMLALEIQKRPVL